MIFVTVGTQLPFDRLIQIVDKLAQTLDIEVYGQIGNGQYEPRNIQWRRFYEPDQLDEAFKNASLVISHAGMGSIINCIRMRTPIVIFPRLSALNEHRNDHQLDTTKSFEHAKGVYVAYEENEVEKHLMNYRSLTPPDGLKNPDKDMLCSYIMEEMQK